MSLCSGTTAILRAAVIATTTLLIAACAPSVETSLAPADLAITGVTVVDVETGQRRTGQTVLVSEERIALVAPTAATAVPSGAAIVDGRGKYLIPGLWDAHVHSSGRKEWHLPLFLANGVTEVRNMNPGTGDAIAVTQSMKRRLASGELLGPRMIAGGPSVDGNPPAATSPIVVHDAEQARRAVDTLANAGMDFVKVYEFVPRDAYFALMARARERGIPVDGHVPFRVLPEEAAAAGQRVIEHLRGMEWGCASDASVRRTETSELIHRLDAMSMDELILAMTQQQRALFDAREESLCRATVEAYRRNGVAVVPTLSVYSRIAHPEEVLDGADARFVPASLAAQWRAMVSSELWSAIQSELAPIPNLQLANLRLLNDGGVVILAGTDVGGGGPEMLIPGRSLHDELALLVDAGLSPLEALQAATIHPAQVFGLGDDLGTITEGKFADLVLLNADPLEDIANARQIEAAVLGGQYFDRATLDALLTKAQTASAGATP